MFSSLQCMYVGATTWAGACLASMRARARMCVCVFVVGCFEVELVSWRVQHVERSSGTGDDQSGRCDDARVMQRRPYAHILCCLSSACQAGDVLRFVLLAMSGSPATFVHGKSCVRYEVDCATGFVASMRRCGCLAVIIAARFCMRLCSGHCAAQRTQRTQCTRCESCAVLLLLCKVHSAQLHAVLFLLLLCCSFFPERCVYCMGGASFI